jgi:hypothetical protein
VEDLEGLDAELRAPTVPPTVDPVDPPASWTAYDIPFLLGQLALALILLESLLDVRLPRVRAVRTREAT